MKFLITYQETPFVVTVVEFFENKEAATEREQELKKLHVWKVSLYSTELLRTSEKPTTA